MSPYERTLEHLSYIIECVTIDATGEAKTELDRLADFVEFDKGFAIENRTAVASQLREALSLYQGGQRGQGSVILGSVSRELWAKVSKSYTTRNINHMRMNKIQRVIVLAAVIVIGIMLLIPPFEIPKLGINPGYSFILLPPQRDVDGNALSFINVEQLIAQWLGVLLIAGLAYWLAMKDE